jgi:hypothetical protein
MDRFEKKIPKHPTDCDLTLAVVLEDVIFRNENGDELVKYSIEADFVVLTYEG